MQSGDTLPGGLEPLGNIQIYVDRGLTVFYRRPRSKKKRIIKKWRKRPWNHRPDLTIYKIAAEADVHPAMYIVHPVMERRLRDAIRENIDLPYRGARNR